MKKTPNDEEEEVTCLGLHGEVGLPLQDGVEQTGVGPGLGVVSVGGRHPGDGGPWRVGTEGRTEGGGR